MTGIQPPARALSARRILPIALIGMLVATMLAPGASARQAPSPDNPAALGSFFDAEMTARMEEHDIAGGVVAVVHDGAPIFLRGYGSANVETRTPVDPETTMFRIGSVTKLFTATAVMQLAEQGKLDLDADVNAYLDFEIPAAYGQPITLRHLLTHTAGFENRWIGMWPDDAEDIEPLGEWLAANIPERVRPPGEVTAYSNYGASLAGYIVERVSGMPYADYIDQHILRPLGMTRTTARQPVPDDLRPALSRGYEWSGGKFEARDFEWLNMAPAGVISASGADMARFMLAHLQGGQYEAARILAAETARQMHARQFANSPTLNGIGYGFYEMSRNGERVIGHGGDTLVFHSVLALFPDRDLGLFVAFNTANAGEAAEDVRDAFIDHFFPAADQDLPAATVDTGTLDDLAGSYRLTNSTYSGVEKFFGLLGAYRVSINGDTLTLAAPAGDEMLPRRVTIYRPVESSDPGELLFQEENGAGLLAFRIDEAGTTYAFVGSAPVFALEQLEWHERPVLHQIALSGLLLTLISGLAAALLAFRHARRLPVPRPAARAAGWLLAVLGALSLLLLLGLGVVVIRIQQLFAGDVTLLSTVLVIPPLIVAGSLAAAVLAIPLWRGHEWTLAGRIHYTLITLAGLALTWFLAYWNLLGWHY